jgi:hypothetical protein
MVSESIEKIYGVKYYHTSTPIIHKSSLDQVYYFKTFIGSQRDTINVEVGDCIFYFSEDLKTAILRRGPCQINSIHCATIIRGYMPSEMVVSLEGITLLPYVNGCSTRQLIPPPRPGDPTLQFLKIPAFTSEQVHHIHSTVRVVYVLAGKGKSIVGTKDKFISNELISGTVCILDPMCPHHFETQYEQLNVIPLHIFSSIHNVEKMHPMFSGTHLMNQHG